MADFVQPGQGHRTAHQAAVLERLDQAEAKVIELGKRIERFSPAVAADTKLELLDELLEVKQLIWQTRRGVLGESMNV